MVGNSAGSPVFADRYKFQTVSDDWDKGRSGFTHLVFDIQKERLGVIKRAEIKSQQAVDRLKNEVAALLSLKGLGVPEVYGTGEAEYGSKNYFYMVIEYIDGIRVEKNLDTLTAPERVEILTQFFSLLANSHKMGIVNGDVDLKHLFWRRNKKQLVVIDWGNAKLGLDLKKKTDFAYDLARAAEIIFSLITQSHLPATGSIALPDDLELTSALPPVPIEFRNLCKWAPRTPSDGSQAPYTALELLEISKRWLDPINDSNLYKSNYPIHKKSRVLGILFAVIVVFAIFSLIFTLPRFTNPPITSATSTSTLIKTPSAFPSNPPTLTETIAPTIALPTITFTESPTSTPVITPSPYKYSPILIFDNKMSLDKCWVNEPIPPSKLLPYDGFYRRTDNNKDWGFKIVKNHPIEDVIQVDFSQCLLGKKIGAVALNVAVQRLDIPAYPANESSREFGIFLENQKGQRREYTLWLDKGGIMYLRILENSDKPKDYPILVVSSANLKLDGEYPRPSYRFPIQIFIEINNQGLDIIYLLESSLVKSISAEAIDPSQMIRIDNAVLPTFGDFQKIGMVGHGGQIDALIWPLAFWEYIPR